MSGVLWSKPVAKIYSENWHQAQSRDDRAPNTQFPSLPSCLSDMQTTRGSQNVSDEEMQQKLLSIIALRRLRQTHFSADLFADPAWDILLDLALAERQQRRVCVSSLCIGAQVPTTTALRWIKHMTDSGWLVRMDDPLDARRKFVELSEETASKMLEFLTQLCRDPAVSDV